jgi:hypothetical protein
VGTTRSGGLRPGTPREPRGAPSLATRSETRTAALRCSATARNVEAQNRIISRAYAILKCTPMHLIGTTKRVAVWAYEQAADRGEQTWLRGRDTLQPLGDDWRSCEITARTNTKCTINQQPVPTVGTLFELCLFSHAERVSDKRTLKRGLRFNYCLYNQCVTRFCDASWTGAAEASADQGVVTCASPSGLARLPVLPGSRFRSNGRTPYPRWGWDSVGWFSRKTKRGALGGLCQRTRRR